jgi:YHS domain-containing protein
MKTRLLRLAIGALFLPGVASAQHEAHQTTGTQAVSADLSECVRVQPAIQNIIAGASARAEAARLTNSPSELRAALGHLEAALRDIRAQSEPCSRAATSFDPHAGHSMPDATKPAPAQPKPAAADPHAGHSSQPPAAKEMDPVNGLVVDPATAPKTTYQGVTYYFSSEQSRKEFLQNPAKFAKKPKK